MKNVLVIITTSFVSYGGLTTVAMNYNRHIDKKKIHMDFASTNDLPDNLGKELEKNHSKYFKLPKRSNVVKYVSELNTLSKGYDIAHIHANSATASIELFAVRNVKRRVVHIHNSTCSHKIIHNLLMPYFKRSYTDAIACSKLAGEWIFGKGKFIVLNNAIDLDQYNYSEIDRKEIRNRLCIDDKFVIGHVGKINEQKNHSFIIDVFKEIVESNTESVLLLIGDGALRKQIEEKVNSNNLRKKVIFCGMIPNAKEYYSAFDCILFPSLWEGLPLSLLEAQASGLTCVASDRITSEVDMGGVIRLSLSSGIQTWTENVERIKNYDRTKNIAEFRQNLTVAGYDIKKNVEKLESIYIS